MYALFIERAQQVKEILNGFTDSVVNVAKGAIASASKRLEGVLGKSIPVLIGVLADYLGIGGIPEKIQGFLKKGQKWVDANVMPIIDKILDKVAGIFAKLPSVDIADYMPKGMGMGNLYGKLRQQLGKVTKKPFANLDKARSAVNLVGTAFKPMGLKSLNLEPADNTGHNFNVIAAKPLPGKKLSPVLGRVKTFNNIQRRSSSGVNRGVSVKVRHLNTSFMARSQNLPLKTNHLMRQNSIASFQRKPVSLTSKQIVSKVTPIAVEPKPTFANFIKQKPLLVSTLSRQLMLQKVGEKGNNNVGVCQVQNPSKQDDSSIIDVIHTALDVAGLVPALGVVPDGINAGIYLIRGKWVEAGISAAAMIPFLGQGTTATKHTVKISKEVVEKEGKNGLIQAFKQAKKVKMNDVYEIAKQGGKHSGTYQQALKQSPKELQKGIKKYQRRIDEHKSLINNPKVIMEKLGKGDWDNLDSRQKKALIEKKWPSDVQRLTEQKTILEVVLTEKYGY